MFERFTERARQVIVLAQDEARALKHHWIGTEHLLLGLLRESEGLAARVLDELGLTVEQVRVEVVRIVGEGEEVTGGQIPFTPRAKKVLELSLREALSLGHNYIGTEHILLGLVRENEGVAAKILLGLGASADTIRDKIISMLSGPGAPRPEPFVPGAAAPTSRWREPHWEFRVELLPTDDLSDRVEWLNELGSQRWQLAGTLPSGNEVQLIFQRPGLTPRPTPRAPGIPVEVESGLTVVRLARALAITIPDVIEAFNELGLAKTANQALTDDELTDLAALLRRKITITHPDG